MMHMEHRLHQTQTQRLMLTQKMQQAIQILQLSTVELEQFVQQELETNPVLEQAPVEREKPLTTDQADTKGPVDESAQFDDGSFDIDSYTDKLTNFHAEGADLSHNPDVADWRRYYEDSITQEESLKSRIMSQLNMTAENEQETAIGERIIGELDNRGYFMGDLEEVAKDLNVPADHVESMLHRMQRFEPTGVCARDVIECLLLQINTEYPDEPQLAELVEHHLEPLERRQIPAIAKAMSITPDRVEELKSMLAMLNPWPGHEFSDQPTQYIAADVTVERTDDDDIILYLSDGMSPTLHISDDYRAMAKNKATGKDDKRYIREHVESAKWLIRNIEQRQQTILRIAQAITEVQHDFMLKGQEYLKPLTLQEIADKVGVHEATVSRTTRGKYMQTPQGLLEMKFFFSPGLKKDGGEAEASKAVMTMIQKIIDEENKAKPLSDQKVANLLKDRGINIARRTVTKYRETLGILSTTLRRSYEANGK
jgi:RNA polymerase sigma-54 factor